MNKMQGSRDIGINNPTEWHSRWVALRGAIITVLGIIALLWVAKITQQSRFAGWILAGFGFALISGGVYALYEGIVGRSSFF